MQIHHMVGRSLAGLMMLVMLNAMALGDGLFSLRGSACDLTMASAPMKGMAGMDVTGVKMPTPGNHSDEPAGGCNLPWAPGCTSIVPCAPAAIVVDRVQLSVQAEPRFRVRIADSRAPESPAIAPEFPPPRI
jgi:hypothetical protein